MAVVYRGRKKHLAPIKVKTMVFCSSHHKNSTHVVCHMFDAVDLCIFGGTKNSPAHIMPSNVSNVLTPGIPEMTGFL